MIAHGLFAKVATTVVTGAVGAAAYDHWFATQLGMREKLDGNEKCVHVHVGDGRMNGRGCAAG